MKVMQLSTTKIIWEKIVQSYQGETKVEKGKIQSYRIQYESLRMHENEIIENFFLRVDDIVSTMRGFRDNIEYVAFSQNIFRSLTPNFNAKVFSIKEMQDLKSLTLELHGILIAY